MAKILMINLPYAGHTNPTLPLVRCLVARGHEVSYIHAPEWQKKITATGATFIPYLDYPTGLSVQQKKRRCFSAAYRTLMAVGKDYDLLIYEMLFFPAKKLADRLGIPCVRQFSQPAWNQEAFQKLESSSKVFLLSSRLIGKQPMRATFDHRFIFVPPTIAQSQVSSVEIPYEQMAGPTFIFHLARLSAVSLFIVNASMPLLISQSP